MGPVTRWLDSHVLSAKQAKADSFVESQTLRTAK